MAKVKFGMMMTDARGKLGGQVFSKNRGGSYVRTKVTPSNPRTDAQMQSRLILGQVSQAWSGLTATQIAGWNEAVNDWKSTDVFGDLKTPSGKALFTQLNKNILQSGGSLLNAVPSKMELQDVSGFVPTFHIGDAELTLGIGTVSANNVLQVWASAPVSLGTKNVSNRMRVIAYVPAGATSATALYSAYVAKFGAPALSDNIYVQVRAIGTNGQAGVRINKKATVSA